MNKACGIITIILILIFISCYTVKGVNLEYSVNFNSKNIHEIVEDLT